MPTPENNSDLLLPTTQVFNISPFEDNKLSEENFMTFVTGLQTWANRSNIASNYKDIAIYNTTEQINGQVFFYKPASENYDGSFGYRLVVQCGALPNAGTTTTVTTTTPNANYVLTRIYGTATNTTSFAGIPLPYASPTLNKNIQLDVNISVGGFYEVVITTGINWSAYNYTQVILEYTKI